MCFKTSYFSKIPYYLLLFYRQALQKLPEVFAKDMDTIIDQQQGMDFTTKATWKAKFQEDPREFLVQRVEGLESLLAQLMGASTVEASLAVMEQIQWWILLAAKDQIACELNVQVTWSNFKMQVKDLNAWGYCLLASTHPWVYTIRQTLKDEAMQMAEITALTIMLECEVLFKIQ